MLRVRDVALAALMVLFSSCTLITKVDRDRAHRQQTGGSPAARSNETTPSEEAPADSPTTIDAGDASDSR